MGDYVRDEYGDRYPRPKTAAEKQREAEARAERDEALDARHVYESQRAPCHFHCSKCGSTEFSDHEETHIAEPDIFLCAGCGEIMEHRLHFVNTDPHYDTIPPPREVAWW